jgi:Family of unknown function (DUF5989)
VAPNKFDDFAGWTSEARPGLLSEYWDFLKYNKKWWLLPILLMMLVLGALLMLSGSGAGPLIYSLF